MELRGYKQATAHSHERTKNSNPSENNFRDDKNSNSNLLIYSKNPRNRSNLFPGAWYPFSSQSFPSDNTAGLLSRTFIVKKISNSFTYTVASSCVCTSRLAVMIIVRLHDFVKVSISASLKSFLLIICIDAPESTTDSLSSGLRVDAGRHLFSEGEKNVALSCSFNLNTFLASFYTASRAPCSCHSVSF